MTVLNIHAGSDTGGQTIRTHRAFLREAPDWRYLAVNRPNMRSYINYPAVLHWDTRTVKQWALEADVFHVHNDFRTAKMVERTGKPMVAHYHGTAYRIDPSPRLREQLRRKAIGLVSTLDLWLIAPDDTEWLPAPYDLEWLADIGIENRRSDDGLVRIAHAPTERTIKSTEDFVKAVHRLQDEGYPVQMELIERESWDTCLKRKASADIYFDQVILGYGCNAIEAWGMGVPVVAGGADATLDEMERRFGGLPFYHATPSTIYESLRDMVESPELRKRYSRTGLEHARAWHDDVKIVRQLQDTYHRAIETYARKRAA